MEKAWVLMRFLRMIVSSLRGDKRSALKSPVTTMCWYKEIKADNVSKRKYEDNAEGLL